MPIASPLPQGRKVSAGVADPKVSRDQEDLPCSAPLGASLGTILYDPALRIGGLLHSLLPASGINPGKTSKRPALFIDGGLKVFLGKLRRTGRDEVSTRQTGEAEMRILC